MKAGGAILADKLKTNGSGAINKLGSHGSHHHNLGDDHSPVAQPRASGTMVRVQHMASSSIRRAFSLRASFEERCVLEDTVEGEVDDLAALLEGSCRLANLLLVMACLGEGGGWGGPPRGTARCDWAPSDSPEPCSLPPNQDDEKRNVFHLAALAGHDRVLGLLLEHAASPHSVVSLHAALSSRDVWGNTPLLCAAKNCDDDRGATLRCARVLLRYGADPSEASHATGDSALQWLCRTAQPACVALILNHWNAASFVSHFNHNSKVRHSAPPACALKCPPTHGSSRPAPPPAHGHAVTRGQSALDVAGNTYIEACRTRQLTPYKALYTVEMVKDSLRIVKMLIDTLPSILARSARGVAGQEGSQDGLQGRGPRGQ